MHTYLFAFGGGVVENGIIENEKTNEKLIIGYTDSWQLSSKLVAIQRSAKETIDS